MDAILRDLGVARAAPSLAFLDALVKAYTERVPWESASRIVRRAQVAQAADCPRWPEMFWQGARQHGTGGTCFESNYAFLWLLRGLGFDEGYLTINDMGDSVGCHSAIVITLPDVGRYLVDVGLPLYVPIPLPVQDGATTARESRFHTYRIVPQGENRYDIMRDNHPRPICFTLVDAPIADAAYRQATAADYDTDGLFLDRVIVVKVVEGYIWRFNDEDRPHHLERLGGADKTYHLLDEDRPRAAGQIAEKFSMDADLIHQALLLTENQAKE